MTTETRQLLEEDWAEWCRRKIEGRTDDEFLYARELLEERQEE